MNISQRLTTTQQRVIAQLAAAESPEAAYRAVTVGANVRAATGLLMQMGVLTLANGQAQLTDIGKQVGTRQGILDDGGMVSQNGQKLIPQAADTTSAQPSPDLDNFPIDGGQQLGGEPNDPQLQEPGGLEDPNAQDSSLLPPQQESFSLLGLLERRGAQLSRASGGAV